MVYVHIMHCKLFFNIDTPFCVMYNRDAVTSFELADNQRDVNLSGESMATVDQAAKIKKTFTSLCLQKVIAILRSHR